MTSPYQSDLLRNKKPMKKKGEKLHPSDEHIEEALEAEIDRMEDLEEETDYAELQGKSKEALCEEITKLRQELIKSHDQLLRSNAEIENVRRRARQDVEGAHKYGLEKFVKELLPVLDSLEQALASEPDDCVSLMHEGVDLTNKMLIKTIQQFGVEIIDPLNQSFDPQLHEAMTAQENAEVDPNTVMLVLQKGYALNNRVIRPARVIVSK